MKFNIPDKLYFKIGEVGKLAKVPTHVLRYWETEFKGIKPKRASSRQRLYRREDVELIVKIKTLLHEQGYTIAGARKLIDTELEIPPQQSATAHRRAVDTLTAVKAELLQLQQLIDKKQ